MEAWPGNRDVPGEAEAGGAAGVMVTVLGKGMEAAGGLERHGPAEQVGALGCEVISLERVPVYP